MVFLIGGVAKSNPRAIVQRAVNSLVKQDLVVPERPPRGAYSLTESGYAASLSS